MNGAIDQRTLAVFFRRMPEIKVAEVFSAFVPMAVAEH